MANDFCWGPANPHPLSKMRTELVWEGKYDEYGNRREVSVGELAMPMQRIETEDEPRQRAAALGQLNLFEQQIAKRSTGVSPVTGASASCTGVPPVMAGDCVTEDNHGRDARAPFRNRLIWGDNKLVMASLLKEFKGKVDLICIDPPFDVGADFTMDVPIGDEKETVGKDQSTLEMVAYRDMWGKGTDSYLHMMFERLTLMKELLSEKGSICVHCDWRVVGKLKSLLEEVFGSDRHINEIIWVHQIMGGAHGARLPKAHETVLWFAKGENFKINAAAKETRVPFSDYVKNTMQKDEEGRWFYTRRRMSRKATSSEKSFKSPYNNLRRRPGIRHSCPGCLV